MEIVIPVRTLSEANLRCHWGQRARRAKRQRVAARILVRAAFTRLLERGPCGGYRVTLTRIAPRVLDSDNLAISLKAVRDGVADALGVSDADGLCSWSYAQWRGKKREYAVAVDIV